MPCKVVITTGARLHFGLLANAAATGRNFGGAGLMVDTPRFKISVEPAAADTFIGDEQFCRRARQFVTTYRASCSASNRAPGVRVEVFEGIPAHNGFGSGTQFGMAIAKAMSLLTSAVGAAPTLARRVGRGGRSAIGIHGFARGGFLVDGGKLHPNEIAPPLSREDFPDAWRMLLVTPDASTTVSGDAEIDAFARLEPMPASTTNRLCEILVRSILPAIVEQGFDACGEALFEFGRTVGEYFAPAQGGVFANEQMARLAGHLRQQGARGVGQTSWGPTLFVLCDSARHAQQLNDELSADARWDGCHIRVAAPKNSAADVVSVK